MAASNGRDARPRRLLVLTPIDAPDKLEASMMSAHEELAQSIANMSENQVERLVQARAAEPAQYKRLVHALMFHILSEDNQKRAAVFLKYLMVANNDGHETAMGVLANIVEQYRKLTPTCRVQLLFLVARMIEYKVPRSNQLCASLLRQIPGGSVDDGSLWLTFNCLRLLKAQMTWLITHLELTSLVIYHFLRIMIDHANMRGRKNIASLFSDEAAFVVSLMLKKPEAWHNIGRDLIRVLSFLYRVPDLKPIWEQLFVNYESDPTTEQGIRKLPDDKREPSPLLLRILSTPTPAIFLQARLTNDMETHLKYILTQVKFGHQQRYQHWFASRHIRESESLVCDLVRYVCRAYHPSNEMLRSKVCPRWVVLGWLFGVIKSGNNHGIIQAMLYDFMFFQEGETVMDVEPPTLLLLNSLQKFTYITTAVLDTLVKYPETFAVGLRPFILKNVNRALVQIRLLGVARSFRTVSTHKKIPAPLLARLKSLYPEHFGDETGPMTSPRPSPRPTPDSSPHQSPRHRPDVPEDSRSTDRKRSEPEPSTDSDVDGNVSDGKDEPAEKKQRQTYKQPKSKLRSKKSARDSNDSRRQEAKDERKLAISALKDLETHADAFLASVTAHGEDKDVKEKLEVLTLKALSHASNHIKHMLSTQPAEVAITSFAEEVASLLLKACHEMLVASPVGRSFLTWAEGAVKSQPPFVLAVLSAMHAKQPELGSQLLLCSAQHSAYTAVYMSWVKHQSQHTRTTAETIFNTDFKAIQAHGPDIASNAILKLFTQSAKEKHHGASNKQLSLSSLVQNSIVLLEYICLFMLPQHLLALQRLCATAPNWGLITSVEQFVNISRETIAWHDHTQLVFWNVCHPYLLSASIEDLLHLMQNTIALLLDDTVVNDTTQYVAAMHRLLQSVGPKSSEKGNLLDGLVASAESVPVHEFGEGVLLGWMARHPRRTVDTLVRYLQKGAAGKRAVWQTVAKALVAFVQQRSRQDKFVTLLRGNKTLLNHFSDFPSTYEALTVKAPSPPGSQPPVSADLKMDARSFSAWESLGQE